MGIPLNNTVISDKTAINLSNRTLTASELDVFSLGLSYSLPKFKINFVEHYFAFENLVNTLKYSPYKSMNWGSLKTDIATVAHSSFREFNTFKHSFMILPQVLYYALIKLRTDDSIIITKPDKGRGTVIMNKKDYIMKIENILNDLSKFKLIKDNCFHYITKLEDKLARLLRQHLKLNVIIKDIFNNLFTSGSSPGFLYGLPKIHKTGNSIRSIFSTINTFNYKLDKYFVPILEPLTLNEFTLKFFYEFVKEINKLDVHNTDMASFDIKSLFTNIPLDETIEIISN